MTYQNKAELFRIYLEGRITIEANERKRVVQDLLDQDFASDAWVGLTEKIDRINTKITVLKQIQHRFNDIFKEDDQ